MDEVICDECGSTDVDLDLDGWVCQECGAIVDVESQLEAIANP